MSSEVSYFFKTFSAALIFIWWIKKWSWCDSANTCRASMMLNYKISDNFFRDKCCESTPNCSFLLLLLSCTIKTFSWVLAEYSVEFWRWILCLGNSSWWHILWFRLPVLCFIMFLCIAHFKCYLIFDKII